MDPGAAYEGRRGMAGVAIQAGLKVGGVDLGIFANRSHAVMTRSTIVQDTGMVEHRPDEGAGVMTDPTVLACCYMTACFAGRKRTIMAGAAVIDDANVIKDCRYESCRLMAHAAILVCRYMVRWWGSTPGGCTIVAGCTVIHDALVIKPRIGKDRGNMAHRAILGGRDVCRVGLGIFAGGDYTIVA